MDERSAGAPETESAAPSCDHGVPVPIVYGFPSTEMFEASQRGDVALGGCVVEASSPTWRCTACGLEWGGPPARIDGIAAFLLGTPMEWGCVAQR